MDPAGKQMALSDLETYLLSAAASVSFKKQAAGRIQDVDNVVEGNYGVLLSLGHLTSLAGLEAAPEGVAALPAWFQKFRIAIHDRTFAALQDGQRDDLMSILATAVAALLTFVQENITGPESDLEECGQWFIAHKSHSAESLTTMRAENHAWAELQLHVDGEDLVSTLRNPFGLLLARTILVEPLRLKSILEDDVEALSDVQSEGLAPKNDPVRIGDFEMDVEEMDAWESDAKVVAQTLSELVPTWYWWVGRCVAVHQEFLSARSGTLRAELFAASERMETMQIGVLSLLERALWECAYKQTEAAKRLLKRAEELAEIDISTTGVMGKRTIHQQDPKPQLVLKVEKKSADIIQDHKGLDTSMLGFSYGEAKPSSELEEMGKSDVLQNPQFDPEDAAATVPELSAEEQCIVLARSVLVELGSAKDELRSWQMMPYIEAILVQRQSHFILQAHAALHKARHEFERSRTRERSLVVLEDLVKNLRTPGHSEVEKHRIKFVFSVPLISIVSLRKENCEQMVASGLVGSALQAYEEMCMWDNLILCYRLLDKNAQAEALVLRQLEKDGDSPKLLCALGDLRNDDKYYKKAWSVSGHKYARAKRSLARSAMTRKDYSEAAKNFDRALILNPMHPDIWFSLGYCYLKIEDNEGALKSFSRCAQLDPDNGEAWNNLGALWLKVGKSKRAFWAFKEALKHKSGSWETWENFARASLESGNLTQSIRGLSTVLEITNGKRLQTTLVKELLAKREQYVSDSKLGGPTETTTSLTQSDLDGFNDALTKFLTAASSATAWTPEMWWLRGKFHAINGDSSLAKDCWMKASRLLQGSAWKKDVNHFQMLAGVLLDLAQNLIKSATDLHESQQPRGSIKGDISSLRMTIRGVVKSAHQQFSESPELGLLETALANILERESQL